MRDVTWASSCVVVVIRLYATVCSTLEHCGRRPAACRGPMPRRTGSGSGHGWVVGVTSLLFCNFFCQKVKMKCPKSKEFFCFTPMSIHCEQNFDVRNALRGHRRCVAHHLRHTSGTQLRDALKPTSLAYGQHTPFPLQCSSHASICMTQ